MMFFMNNHDSQHLPVQPLLNKVVSVSEQCSQWLMSQAMRKRGGASHHLSVIFSLIIIVIIIRSRMGSHLLGFFFKVSLCSSDAQFELDIVVYMWVKFWWHIFMIKLQRNRAGGLP